MQLFVRGLETIEALEVSQDATIAGVKVSDCGSHDNKNFPLTSFLLFVAS